MRCKIVRSRLFLLLILSVFIFMTSLYSWIIPMYEAPDENGHFNKMNFLYTRHRLPIASENVPIKNQPPLYHVIGAGFLWIMRVGTLKVKPVLSPSIEKKALYIHSELELDFHSSQVQAFYLLRLFSLILGVATVFVTYKSAKIFFKDDERLALMAAAINAFIPQFIFMSSVVNYDVMVALFSGLSIFYLTGLLISQKSIVYRKSILSGLAGGAAMLTKLTGIFIPLVAICSLLLRRFFKNGFSKRTVIINISIITGIMFLVSGWFYVRNQLLYQNLVYIGKNKSEFNLYAYFFINSGHFFRELFKSFWLRFGWMNIPAPSVIYWILAGFSICAMVGVCWTLTSSFKRKENQFILLGVFILSTLLVFSEVVAYNTYTIQPQGRFMFPAISAISILMIEGLRTVSYRFLRNHLIPLSMIIFLLLISGGGVILLLQAYS